MLGGLPLLLVGDHRGLDECASELAAVTSEQGFPFWGAAGTMYDGWLAVGTGDAVKGMSLLRSGLSAYSATGAQINYSVFADLLARACEIVGEIEEGRALFDDALQVVERTGERWFAAELNRHKGHLLLRQRHVEAAQELYREALTIAREQQAKLWELRASMSLARLRRDQGREADARDLLMPVYGWFTEGFDTRDLKEAKALLDELGCA